jgi:hypothetical protein
LLRATPFTSELRAGPRYLVLADTILTEAAPAFAGFEGRGFLLHELWLIELWTAFAESAVIESPVLTATSKAATESYGFSGRRWQTSIQWTCALRPRERAITLVILLLPSRRSHTYCHEYATVLVYSQAVAFWS